MWGEDDTFGRWFQGLCAIPLLGWTFLVLYLLARGYHMGYSYGTGGTCTGAGSAYLGYRCLYYAITGRDNINRDDYD